MPTILWQSHMPESVTKWNDLPESVIAGRSIDSFKNLLDWHFSSQMFTIASGIAFVS